jgi:hypothetical protein
MSIVRAVEVLLESIPSIPEAARKEVQDILDGLKGTTPSSSTAVTVPSEAAATPPQAEAPDTATAVPAETAPAGESQPAEAAPAETPSPES